MLFATVVLALFLQGCAIHPNYVIFISGTTVGFDVSQAPAAETPQATLAYKRVEVAIVPCTTNGDVPDTLMDFDFKTAIFTSGGGIHSRIATGPHATTQTPASIMMSKDSNGLFPTNLPTVLPNIK